MNLWSRKKKGSSAAGFGNSTQKKARRRPQTFRLEEIKTPLVVFPFGGHESDSVRHLLNSLHWPNLSDIFAGNTCPLQPPAPPHIPGGGVTPLFNIDDPWGLSAGGPPVYRNWGGDVGPLPPPVVVPIDPSLPQREYNGGNFIDPALLDFPEANQPMVGAIDTGISVNNPYFDYSKITLGRDYVDGDDNPLLEPGEGNEHGTFSLGLIAGINKKLPLWVGRAIGSGKWADSLVDFVNAANLAGKKNAIVNLSLDLTQVNPDGSVTTRYEFTPYERAALEYARQHGVMIVAAAGNDGGVMSVLGQASQEFDNIITVGSGDIKGRDSYSSYGRGLDIMADGGTTENPVFSTVGSGFGTMAGTSVATAKVTGAASLVWAANPDLNYRQVIEILEQTARDLGSPGWDDETGFGLLNVAAAVELAKVTKPEVYNPTPWYAPDTWSGEGIVTPEERAAQGGNSIATATVQVSPTFSDSDRLDSTQPEKYYQFTVNEPGYVRWNLTSLNPALGAGRSGVTIIKADGSSASHRFHQGTVVKSSVVTQRQTSFSDGDFYDPGTYYLKVGNSAFKDYNISTQFIADGVSSFTGNIQYRTQPYKSLNNSQNAIFSGPTVSELKNLSGVVTYNEIDYNSRIAKYGFEVKESGKFRINLNSPNGKMELNIDKFIGSEDKPVRISGFEASANSDEWLEVDLNKGRYEIAVKTPSDNWLEPDWNSTQKTLVRPYTLNATFTPNAPQPGQGKVPASAGAFNKTVVSKSGVVNHYYANGYLTVQPSGQANWISYGSGRVVVSTSVQRINEPVPRTDPDGNDTEAKAKEFFPPNVASRSMGDSLGGNDRIEYYKFTLQEKRFVNFSVNSLSAGVNLLVRDPQKNHSDSIDSSGTNPIQWNRILDPGTYYVAVSLGQDAIRKGLTTPYGLGISTNPPEGQIFQGSSSGSVYLIQNGQRYPILAPRVDLAAMGINWDRVWSVPDSDINGIPLGDSDGNFSMRTAKNLLDSGADLGDGIDRRNAVGSIGGNNLSDFYKFSLNSLKLVNLNLSQLTNGAKLELIQDRNGNGQVDFGEVINTGATSGSPLSRDLILGAGNYYLRVSPGSSGATTKYQVGVAEQSLENKVIAGFNSDYYLVQNGKLRQIPNQETLQKILDQLGINPNTVKQFPPEDLARIPGGDNLPSRKDGSLLRGINGDGKVYQMQSGLRRWIPDAETFNAMRLDWNAIKEFPINDVNAIKPGQDFPSQKNVSKISNNFDTDRLVASVPYAEWSGFAQQSIPLILDECKASGITDLGQIAYILATSEHESHCGQLIRELWGPTADQLTYEGRADLGNDQVGDGYRYRGRGYTQITGKKNYREWSNRLGVDLVSNPERATEPAIAAKIIVQGMQDGTFRPGNKLSDYINASQQDFYNARAIVNSDKSYVTDIYKPKTNGQGIAEIAQRYFNILKTGSSNNTGTTPQNPSPSDPPDFKGKVKPDSLNICSGPGTNYAPPISSASKGTELTFDGWTNGTPVYDHEAGANDARWFRIKGTNSWVASAYIDQNPPANSRYIDPNSIAPPSGGSNNGGNNSGGNSISSGLPTSASAAKPFFKTQFRTDYNTDGPDRSTNCGPASLAMVLEVLGYEPPGLSTQQSISRLEYIKELNVNGRSDRTDQNELMQGVRDNGLSAEYLSGWATLDQSLASGKPVILLGTITDNWRAQFPQRYGDGNVDHWNTILGKTPDGKKYIVADPMHTGGPVEMTKDQILVYCGSVPDFISVSKS